MDRELRVDRFILRLQGRVFEIFAIDSDYNHRLHVDTVMFQAAEGRNGKTKVRIGRADGDRFGGGTRTEISMEADEFRRFEGLVEAVKAAQAAGPEPW
jgi:hypothetical protein